MAKRGKLKERPRELSVRPTTTRHYKEFFLIVCEDESTEPAYFRKVFQEKFEELLPKDTIRIETVGTGRNSLGVVEKAVEERISRTEIVPKAIDHVWAVFDKDDLDQNETTAKRFEEAFSVAAANDINIAYSNECFELWLLLHFVNVNNSKPIPRKATEDVDKSSCLYGMLENAINKGRMPEQQIIYDHAHHSKPFISVEELISIIMKSGDEAKAIERAQNLDASQQNKKPIEANPNTTVYKLVKELREWLEFYGQ
jgi:hypothetical protein